MSGVSGGRSAEGGSVAETPPKCWCDGFRHLHNPGSYSWQCPSDPVSREDGEYRTSAAAEVESCATYWARSDK